MPPVFVLFVLDRKTISSKVSIVADVPADAMALALLHGQRRRRHGWRWRAVCWWRWSSWAEKRDQEGDETDHHEDS